MGTSNNLVTTNAFEMHIPSMSEILSVERNRKFIFETLEGVLIHLGIENIGKVANDIIDLALKARNLAEYEKKGHEILVKAGVIDAIPEKLSGRADLIFSQIKPHLFGNKVCDLGCGDGKVGVKASEDSYKVFLADVYKHDNISSTGLAFQPFRQGEAVPFADGIFDTTLLLTVLHHADDPKALLQEGVRITREGGTVILIESVFGISKEDAATAEHQSTAFINLSSEEQRITNIFFDHFYNRLIHYSEDSETKVNVPFNFNTPPNWAKLAEECGAKEENLIQLGIDQPAVPEYHTLHVIKVS